MANLSSKTFETAIRVVTLLILVAILAQLVAVHRKLDTIYRNTPNGYDFSEAFFESLKRKSLPVSITDIDNRVEMPIKGKVEVTNPWEFGE